LPCHFQVPEGKMDGLTSFLPKSNATGIIGTCF
jgi:hypothetical protein